MQLELDGRGGGLGGGVFVTFLVTVISCNTVKVDNAVLNYKLPLFPEGVLRSMC